MADLRPPPAQAYDTPEQLVCALRGLDEEHAAEIIRERDLAIIRFAGSLIKGSNEFGRELAREDES